MNKLKSTIVAVYLCVGLATCVFLVVAAAAGWKLPESNTSWSSGRSYGGSWGGGK